MGRYSPEKAYSFKCWKLFNDCYDISWIIDFYYKGSRQRFPRCFRRETDEKGARKFCKKHGLDFDKINKKD